MNASLSIKLDHNNYLIWSEQIENLIIAYSLEGFIDGSIVAHAQFLDLGRSILNPFFLIGIDLIVQLRAEYML